MYSKLIISCILQSLLVITVSNYAETSSIANHAVYDGLRQSGNGDTFVLLRKKRGTPTTDVDSLSLTQDDDSEVKANADEATKKRNGESVVTRSVSRFPKQFCDLEVDNGIICPGLRRGSFIEQFYYDSDNNRCSHFVYNGCGGNANRFSSLWECTQFCVNPSSDGEGATLE